MKDVEYKRIAVKVGSNVLTRSDGTLDLTRMSALVDQVAALRARGTEVVLISSGAMASGRSLLKASLPQRPLDPVSERQLFSAVGQAKLINRYYDLFSDHGLMCGQVLTTKESFATRDHYLNQKHCMEVMLDAGVIPVVNENDTISVTELMFTDNDELSGLVATMMGAQALIILTNVDGVYDGNPSNPEARLIATVPHGRRMNERSFIQQGKSSFGRGGMATKYRIARKVANEGIAVIIANGKRDNILLDVTSGTADVPFTLFEPAARTASPVKKWIAHSEGFAKGALHVNHGAWQALTSTTATSLLPVGVERVEGDFKKDDIVAVVSPDGDTFAYGRIAVDSDHARQSLGKQGGKPLIHYNYLVVND